MFTDEGGRILGTCETEKGPAIELQGSGRDCSELRGAVGLGEEKRLFILER